ncbi:MAG: hypothetical protein ABI333_09890 [bacterium]
MSRSAITWAIGLFALVAGAACEGSSVAGNNDGGAPEDGDVRDVELTDVMPVIDTGPDGAPPDALVYPDCNVPVQQPQVLLPGELIRLPPTGQDIIDSVDWDGRRVVYSEYRCPVETSWGGDLFAFDLDTMLESVVAARVGGQTNASVSSGGTVYSDFYFSYFPNAENDRRAELYRYDFGSAQETRLTDGNWPKIMPVYNGSHVAYLSSEWDPQQAVVYDFVLRELSTGQEVVLADHNQNVQRCYDVGDEYVTWQALSPSQPNAFDIFYHHIPTGITDRLYLDSPYLLCPTVSGRRLAWNEARGGSWDAYVVDLDTGIEEQVTGETADQILRPIGGHLLLVVDYRHSFGSFPGNSRDLYLYDLETGINRRLTMQSMRWGGLRPSCQWLIYGEILSSDQSILYAWDMVTAGVVDQDCHVIPCDPETELCSIIEWRGP